MPAGLLHTWLLTSTLLATPAGAHKTDACGEQYDRVLQSNQFATLEFGRDIHVSSGFRPAYQVTCAPANGHAVRLDAAEPSLLGQSVSLNGRFVGYATESCEHDEGPSCQTQLWVDGVIDRTDSRDASQLSVADNPDGLAYRSIPSLRITSAGALAFIVCPDEGRAPGTTQRTCKRPGRRSRVYAYTSHDYKRRLLDKGRGIDPDSMRRKGNLITWRHGTKVRQVRLP